MLWSVTEIAAQPRVLALQDIAGLFVIEILRVPLDQLEVQTIVLGMAPRAIPARSRLHPIRSVQPLPGTQPLRDLGVAIQTPENCLPTKFVTAGALRGAFQRLVRPRERPR